MTESQLPARPDARVRAATVNLANRSRYLSLMDRLGRIPSWEANLLGCFWVGKPKQLRMKEDFWLQPAERQGLTVEAFDEPDDHTLWDHFTQSRFTDLSATNMAPPVTLQLLIIFALGLFVLGAFQKGQEELYSAKSSWYSAKAKVSHWFGSSDSSTPKADPTAVWTLEMREDAQRGNEQLLKNCALSRKMLIAGGKYPDPAEGITYAQGCGYAPSPVEVDYTAHQQSQGAH